ncbi:transcriptional repressor [Microbacterium sp. cx-55]|uniref:Fur family transcriptional regulator n=1 Tax=unclassified Microbacterium TaxID=2609290 RepID=UPI001CBBAB8D|nr:MULTISPECIES: Fur family transcriptional regulator [unclassified Microbacterium]MBZ4488741.1 transcriptional repressor [Microbacterium sp. cx-55]MCC4909572.1 transcriptional repressor [Microbacterium sp. cx-59]UGB36024.1 transcriptional repressor [Microbacterium sp. cx-55]
MTPAPLSPADTAIRGAGLRVTDTRRGVYDALRGMAHARVDEVHSRVRADVPAISLQSVYNALGDFVDAGLARRIEPAGHPGLYEMRVDDNHHHLVCTSCGRVEDVDCVVGEAPCLQPANTHGYRIHTAEVTFWGLCADCADPASGENHLSTEGHS